MVRRAVLASAAILALQGCSRDLEVPSAETLAFAEPTQTAAPRQQLTLVASGGAGGYRFAFATGGALSGEDATVDPATGVYRAGARGSAQSMP